MKYCGFKMVSISVVAPLYNDEAEIERLLESLKSQDFKDYEVIVIDDCSKDRSYDIAKKYSDKKIKVFRNCRNEGPAKTRNKGITLSKSRIIAFIDSDAWAPKQWLREIYEKFKDDRIKVVVGPVKVPKSTFLGSSISSLGFPGGASLGFEKMWKVRNGLTDHITSCNFAIRKDVLKEYGFFDESFPLPGGEDPELSYRLTKNKVRINYFSDVLVYHRPIISFSKWIRWQVARGRSNYHFKRKVGNVGKFLKLRIWSSWNIIKTFLFSLKFPLILFLLFLSFILQQYGFIIEKINDKG